MHPQITCPHCGKPAMPVILKAFLGPLRTRECRACGCRIGVPFWTGWATSLPLMLIVLAGVAIHSLWLLILSLPLGFAMMFALSIYAIPLVAREPEGRRRL